MQHGQFHIGYQEYVLKLKHSFTTAHATTTQRRNFLVKVTYKGVVGYGEAGLPPKKPGCYLADVQDCLSFMKIFETQMSKILEFQNPEQILKIEKYFEIFLQSKHRYQILPFLNVMHKIKNPQYRAGRSALQFSFFDLWSKLQGKSLSECIFNKKIESSFRSFFTVSINQNILEMIKEAEDGSSFTNLIKIKTNNNIEHVKQILKAFHDLKIGEKWVIDANASWTPSTTFEIIQFINNQKLQHKILYLEQPFPIQPDIIQWKKIKQRCDQYNIKIIADESFSIASDLQWLHSIIHGVNIKIEKTGGLINALQAAKQAKSYQKDIWLGSMVCSQLGSSQAFQIHPLAKFGDLDGGLLTIGSFKGGFNWQNEGLLRDISQLGLGVSPI